jgi:DNA-binding MarR family transcriptional regulator
MRIDEAIKAKFRNIEHKTAVNLIFTAHWLEDYFSETLKSYDLTHQQFNVLRILRGSFPMPLTQREIRERMIDKMPDVSRMMEKLKYKGLINCILSPSDRRNNQITISEKGLELLSSIDQIDKQIDKLFDGFSQEELLRFNEFMDKLRR